MMNIRAISAFAVLIILAVSMMCMTYYAENSRQLLTGIKAKFIGNQDFNLSVITNEMIETFSAKQPTFLPEYRNPCWRENVPAVNNLHHENIYSLTKSRVKKKLSKIAGFYSKKLKKGETTRIRCLPFLYLAGFSKSGTTDLYAKINTHPLIASGSFKEPRFWTKRLLELYDVEFETSGNFSHYVQLFDVPAAQISARSVRTRDGRPYFPSVTVDGTPSYIWDAGEWWNNPKNYGLSAPRFIAAHYIKHFTPKAKFVVIMRNPTDRTFSDFMYFDRKDKSVKAFHKLVVNNTNYINQCVNTRPLRECFYEPQMAYRDYFLFRMRVSYYYVFLRDWLAVFPRNQFIFIKFEDYAKSTSSVVSQITRFLGLGPLPKATVQRIDRAKSHMNSNSKHRESMLPETRDILDRHFWSWNQKLANLLKDDKFLWSS